jgi:hypothetical protein
MRASNGYLWAVLLNTTDMVLEVWKSIDNGASYAKVGTVSNLYGVAYDAHLDGSSPQKIHIIWTQSNYWLYNTFNTSTNAWGTAEYLAYGAGAYGSICCDSNNVPHTVFGSGYDYYRNRVGGVWNTAVQLNSYGYCPVAITIDTTSGGNHRTNLPQVAYFYYSGMVAYLGNANNATSFTSVALGSCNFAGSGSLTVDANGRTNFTYSNSNHIYNRYIDGSAAWGTSGNWATESDIFGDSYGNSLPSMVINNNDGGTDRRIFSVNTNTSDVRKAKSPGYGSWSLEDLQTGNFQAALARWQYSNNPSYTTYGYDYLFTDGVSVWFGNVITQPTGTINGTLAAVTGDIEGAPIVGAALAGTLPRVLANLTAQVLVEGVLQGTLGQISGVFSQADRVGQVAGTLAAITGAIAGTVPISASLAGTLPAIQGAFAAFDAITGSFSHTLDAITGEFYGGIYVPPQGKCKIGAYVFDINMTYGSGRGFVSGGMPMEQALDGSVRAYLKYVKKRFNLTLKNISITEKNAILAYYYAHVPFTFYWDFNKSEFISGVFGGPPGFTQDNPNLWSATLEIEEV